VPDTRVIRYRTRPECADENERLIRAVFAQLAERDVTGIRYAAMRLDDGVTFVHVATLDGDDNPLATLPAFAEFQAGIGDRCVDGPHPSAATVIGAHGTEFPA
jgi:hypothetical protein